LKLLLDENLSPRLISRLVDLFGEITHVRDLGLKQADDRVIWNWAKAHGHIVVTTDADFLEMSRQLGFPPKIIHIPECDFPFRVIEDLLRRSAVRIASFEERGDVGVLVPRASP
jgi:predicted nuclease of predicted toxin-antitoxin system